MVLDRTMYIFVTINVPLKDSIGTLQGNACLLHDNECTLKAHAYTSRHDHAQWGNVFTRHDTSYALA